MTMQRGSFSNHRSIPNRLGASTLQIRILEWTPIPISFTTHKGLFSEPWFLSDCIGKPGYPLGHNVIVPRPEYFNGQCAIVAANVHLGCKQEDSLVMNRASLERGMFCSEHIRSYKADVENKEVVGKKPQFEDSVHFGKVQSKIGPVDSPDDDGFAFIGANLQNDDIVAGRCAESGTDHTIKLKHTERGMVHKVVLSANDERNFVCCGIFEAGSNSMSWRQVL